MGSVGVVEELVTEILSRLSIKSLLRFKCVTKFWYSLIEHPYFIKNHYQRNKNNNFGRLLVHNYDTNHKEFAFAVCSDETLADPVYEYLDLRLNLSPFIYGPCNGIFCLYNNVDSMALWNPATREFRPLPQVPRLDLPSSPGKIFQKILRNGFGFDSTTNDYKVVSIITFYENFCGYDSPKTFPIYAAVYTLSTDSWKVSEESVPANTVGNVFSIFYTYSRGVYYWLANDTNDQSILLSFEMGDEVFRNIPLLKDCIEGDFLGFHYLGLYNDCLCWIVTTAYHSDVPNYVYLWVMNKEYHWTKQWTIGPLIGLGSPLAFWKDGELLVVSGQWGLFLCDPSTLEAKYLGTNCIQAFVYHESLVSIKPRYGCQDKCGNSSDNIYVPNLFVVMPDPEGGLVGSDFKDTTVNPVHFVNLNNTNL
ncbi:hypothetical protein LguiA_017205 [Lonicera macranthoides]